MTLADILTCLYPGADFSADIRIEDDGNGQQIVAWNTELYGPQPTEQELLDQAPGLQVTFMQKVLSIHLRQLIESKPAEKEYDSITTLTSYVSSGNAQWKAEADAFIAWRDSLFAYAYQTLADVQAGTIPIPTIEDFLANAPILTWP